MIVNSKKVKWVKYIISPRKEILQGFPSHEFTPAISHHKKVCQTLDLFVILTFKKAM